MDYTIIEDCILDSGSIDCLRMMWDESYGAWTPCQCCKWWDDFCNCAEADYNDWADDRNWPDDNDYVEVVDTDDPFYNTFVKMLGLDGPQ